MNKKSLDSGRRCAKFVEFYLTNGPDMVEEVKYVAAARTRSYEMGIERVKAGKTGTRLRRRKRTSA